MNLPKFAELSRIMPEGFSEDYLKKELERLCTLAWHEGIVLRIDNSIDPLKPQAGVKMTTEVRRARGHYRDE
ncbi:hypothetical protein [Caballeronia sp. LZ034LL]|uniref:hypothetical protein n=1 Tax=Caballeronia sp. LZ034LL TaxID=3038567 RepID=UPI00285F33D9|nr:hypothetical protein [Caballeronia sp. LZ034LL]MDR5839289.1 hypothetical protein [Caballeronia sp. LZ034LL]